ncbi:MAG: hypothetical protein HY291_17360 [Planctomycetes bacterium]|nr:hypothetical protein [Planctomycetota bacterium]
MMGKGMLLCAVATAGLLAGRGWGAEAAKPDERAEAIASFEKAAAELKGQYVSVALKNLGARFEDLKMEDEPPGKLRALTFRPKKVQNVLIRIVLTYDAAVHFSEKRVWDKSALLESRAAAVKVVDETVQQVPEGGPTPGGK